MSVDAKLLGKAVEILRSKNVRADDVEGAMLLLEGYSPYEEMDTGELEAYVEAALGQMRGGSGPRRPAKSGGGKSGGKPRTMPDYMAPFVFVTLADEVAAASAPIPIDIPIKDGYCAMISYELEAETPVLVGGEIERQELHRGAVAPMRFGAAGNYVIPGATIRGLIRAATEIVAYGRLGSSNLHHRFGIRDFEHPYYEKVAKVGQVKAGWLIGEVSPDGAVTAMRITPCDWAHVLIDDMAISPEFKGKVSMREDWIQNGLKNKYAAVAMIARQSGARAEYDFAKTFGFGPKFDDNGPVVRKPAKSGTPGTPVFSGKLPGRDGNKKYEYAFFDLAEASPVDIEPALVDDFIRLNSKPSKNRPTPDGSWRELKPTFDAGRRVPVFYVGDLDVRGRDFFFGLTRMLKVPHERSVGEVLYEQPRHRSSGEWRETVDGKQAITGYRADFVENLFGYVVEPKDLVEDPANISPGSVARKGRVAFSFARLVGGPHVAQLSAPVVVIQSAPRASFSPFYLKPGQPGRAGGEPDYSAERAPRLAGRKRFLPREDKRNVLGRLGKIKEMGVRQLEAVRKSSGGTDPSADVQSQLRFMVPEDPKKPLIFQGEIKLHNVTAPELGAILFALTHGGDPRKPYRHMIGRAKPFGAGQMRLRSLNLAVAPNSGAAVKPAEPDERLSPDASTGFCQVTAAASLKPFLNAFGDHMRRQAGLEAFPDLPSVLEFLGASDPANGAERDAKLDYMPLRSFNPLRRATKPLKDPIAPAASGTGDGRLLAAPSPRKPVFWT
jgi:CRISPR-associated protein (TIGR03986 family)